MQRTHLPASIRSLASSSSRGNWLVLGALAGAVLAGSALFNRASARRAEEDTPPAGRFVEVDGVRLHYVERGTGPAVVLLHGNGVLLQDYEASGVIDAAAAKHRVIAFDRPGFGYTERPSSTSWTPEAQAQLMAKALDKLDAGPAVVVGHSWGTMVALAMALERPDAVSGLVLLSGYYYASARPDVGPFSLPAIPLVGGLLAHTLAPIFGRMLAPIMLKASFSPAPIPETFKAFPLGMTLRPSQIEATASDTSMMIQSAGRLSKRYGELSLPIVVMAGDGDKITFPHKHAEQFAGEVPSAELRIAPGLGHLLHYTLPKGVAEAIESAVTRSAQPASG